MPFVPGSLFLLAWASRSEEEVQGIACEMQHAFPNARTLAPTLSGGRYRTSAGIVLWLYDKYHKELLSWKVLFLHKTKMKFILQSRDQSTCYIWR